jgi:hypothetical protein
MVNGFNTRRQLLAWLGALAIAPKAQAEIAVDLALVLAIDCSLSVDDFDYRLQLRGTGQAMIDSELIQLIEMGNKKVIAVSAFLWSSPDDQQVIVPWRIIETGAAAGRVADDILSAKRIISAGATATGNALAFAQKLLASAPSANRQVIDVSTNGHANMGQPVGPIRDALVAQNVTINGLAVVDVEPNLAGYMQREVIGGAGSFVIEAGNYNAYTQAIRLKLFREIQGTTPA